MSVIGFHETDAAVEPWWGRCAARLILFVVRGEGGGRGGGIRFVGGTGGIALASTQIGAGGIGIGILFIERIHNLAIVFGMFLLTSSIGGLVGLMRGTTR